MGRKVESTQRPLTSKQTEAQHYTATQVENVKDSAFSPARPELIRAQRAQGRPWLCPSRFPVLTLTANYHSNAHAPFSQLCLHPFWSPGSLSSRVHCLSASDLSSVQNVFCGLSDLSVLLGSSLPLFSQCLGVVGKVLCVMNVRKEDYSRWHGWAWPNQLRGLQGRDEDSLKGRNCLWTAALTHATKSQPVLPGWDPLCWDAWTAQPAHTST